MSNPHRFPEDRETQKPKIMQLRKLFYVIGKTFRYLFLLLVILSILFGLIYDTIDCIVMLTPSVLCVLGSYLHNHLQKKNYMEWDKNTNLKEISYGIIFFIGFLLFAILIDFREYLKDNTENINFAIFPLLIFSVTAYLSFMLAKRNALFWIRAFFITIVTLLLIRTFDFALDLGVEPISLDIIYDFLSINFVICVISLGIKGLLITFQPEITALFPKIRYSFWPIYFSIFLWAAAFYAFNI